jgi:hypothetical protein
MVIPMSSKPPFSNYPIEMFPSGVKGVVTEAIALFQSGRVNCHGSWRARLHEISCQTTLLPGQPILAIGREANTLIVIPLHSILWSSYLEDFARFLSSTELEEVQRYDPGDEKW